MKNIKQTIGIGDPQPKPVAKSGSREPVRKVMRMQQLVDYVGLSKSTLYDLQDPNSKRFDPNFPRGVPWTASTKVYVVAEVDAWIEAKILASRAASSGSQAVIE